jgi:hypothetical protein
MKRILWNIDGFKDPKNIDSFQIYEGATSHLSSDLDGKEKFYRSFCTKISAQAETCT